MRGVVQPDNGRVVRAASAQEPKRHLVLYPDPARRRLARRRGRGRGCPSAVNIRATIRPSWHALTAWRHQMSARADICRRASPSSTPSQMSAWADICRRAAPSSLRSPTSTRQRRRPRKWAARSPFAPDTPGEGADLHEVPAPGRSPDSVAGSTLASAARSVPPGHGGALVVVSALDEAGVGELRISPAGHGVAMVAGPGE